MGHDFLVVGLNPTLQNTYFFPAVHLGQVNRAARHRLDVAGKGVNTARILVQLGESVLTISQAGGRRKRLYLELCEEDGVPVRYVEDKGDIRYCHTLIDEKSHTATEIVEAGAPVTPETDRAILALYLETLPAAKTVIIGGSKAPGFSDALYPKMVEAATRAGKRSVLDVRGQDLLGCIPHHPTLVKINVSEFSHTFDPESRLPEDVSPDAIPDRILEQMVELRENHGIEIVLTNGRYPILFVADRKVHSVAPDPVTPVNSIGSGDAFTAGVAAGLSRGLSLENAVALGIECAQANVQSEKPGTLR